jgi:hypothetical protein
MLPPQPASSGAPNINPSALRRVGDMETAHKFNGVEKRGKSVIPAGSTSSRAI